ncbi:Pao retrotransposon peptidase family protein [Dirofilaria immitis]|nr:Pao retrotransposon peptidase family protein [Dirofilaria immitis]
MDQAEHETKKNSHEKLCLKDERNGTNQVNFFKLANSNRFFGIESVANKLQKVSGIKENMIIIEIAKRTRKSEKTAPGFTTCKEEGPKYQNVESKYFDESLHKKEGRRKKYAKMIDDEITNLITEGYKESLSEKFGETLIIKNSLYNELHAVKKHDRKWKAIVEAIERILRQLEVIRENHQHSCIEILIEIKLPGWTVETNCKKSMMCFYYKNCTIAQIAIKDINNTNKLKAHPRPRKKRKSNQIMDLLSSIQLPKREGNFTSMQRSYCV